MSKAGAPSCRASAKSRQTIPRFCDPNWLEIVWPRERSMISRPEGSLAFWLLPNEILADAPILARPSATSYEPPTPIDIASIGKQPESRRRRFFRTWADGSDDNTPLLRGCSNRRSAKFGNRWEVLRQYLREVKTSPRRMPSLVRVWPGVPRDRTHRSSLSVPT